jgi:hypothetical protein
MKRDVFKKILERSKTKEEGVYSYKHIKYLVRGGRLKALVKNKAVFFYEHGFLISRGELESSYSSDWVKYLKKI